MNQNVVVLRARCLEAGQKLANRPVVGTDALEQVPLFIYSFVRQGIFDGSGTPEGRLDVATIADSGFVVGEEYEITIGSVPKIAVARNMPGVRRESKV